ncbi:hypothetical protein EV359DRAFT_45132 [Lentinula novae-zelandiae]|nr:hypothetical protein EV359DRAFT_45132 [Lentinula novae-zelandiae]
MQNPELEITSVALTLTTAETPDIQKAAFLKYVARDVGFKHPLCYVPPGPNSRDSLLGIYQWYHILSPKVIGRMHNVVYDKENHTLLLDMSQKFHIRFCPGTNSPFRLLVRITLKEINGLHYISFQEDFYHPEARIYTFSDFALLLVPMLAPAILFAQAGISVASNVYAGIAQRLGFWRPSPRREIVTTTNTGLYDAGDKID